METNFDFAATYNKRNFNVNTDGYPYVNLDYLYAKYPNKRFILRGFYINTKGKYGDSGVMIIDNACVNLPTHLTDTVKEIMSNENAIDAINSGTVAVSVYEYKITNKKCEGKVFHSIEFVNVTDEVGNGICAVEGK